MAKPKKLSTIERLKRTKTPGAKLYKDATAEERAALLAPIEQVIQQTSERLNAIDLQNDGDVDSIGRADRIAGLSADHIDAMTPGEFVEEVEILHERDKRMARKVANEIRMLSNEVKPVWSIPRSPSDWLKVFAKLNVDCRSVKVFERRRKDGIFRQHPDSAIKSVRLALDCLPPSYSDDLTV